ncbi:MAG: Ig-like domain-containing protein, partial [Armatimonadetes bacterium]|nr:Ig-like domain-containing protein [Armatimonadota bacterium]
VPPSISVGTVTIYLDGRVRLITNGPPYSLTLDASALAQGTHIVKVEVSDQYDGKVKTAEAAFVVAPQK